MQVGNYNPVQYWGPRFFDAMRSAVNERKRFMQQVREHAAREFPDDPPPPPRKRARSVSGRRYVGSFRGRTAGRIRGRRKGAISAPANRGYEGRFEFGETRDDAQAVWAVQTIGARSMMAAVVCALTRKAIISFGLDMRGWRLPITGNAQSEFLWTIAVKKESADPLANFTSAVVQGTSSVKALAESLISLMMTQVTSENYYEINEVALLWRNNDGVNPVDRIEEYRRLGGELFFKVMVKSRLLLQNRTSASVGAADESNALDVANNPLRGRMYFGRNTNVIMKSQYSYSVDNTFLIPGSETGFASVSRIDVPAVNRDIVLKLPPHTAFEGATGYRDFEIAPGAMKESIMVFSKFMSMSSFIKEFIGEMKAHLVIGSVTGAQQHTTFPFRLIGLERKLDTRASEAAVSVGYEIDYSIKSVCYDKRKQAPLYDINVT